MRIASVVLVASLTCCVASSASAADSSGWTLRFHGALVATSNSHDASLDNGIVTNVDAGGGIGLGAEVRLSDRIGLELSALFAGMEIKSKVAGNTGISQRLALNIVPLSFGLPIHFDTGDRVKLFVAPTLSVVRYTDVHNTVGRSGVASNVNVDSDVGLGAALGVDVPFGKGKWAFSSGLRYIKTEAEEADIDPVIVTAGVAYRF